MSFPYKTKSNKPEVENRPVILPEPCNVDAAAAWNEGYRISYLGRSGRYAKGIETEATHTVMYD